MPGKYEFMDEPEPLEIDQGLEDNVYNPDQSVRISSQSVRSLEPLIDGPITLRTIFYDPSWSGLQKRCCIGFLIVLLVICLSVIIALLVGLGRVIGFIKHSQEIREIGLQVFPFNGNDIYFCTKREEHCRQELIASNVKAIDDALEPYKKAKPGVGSFEDCPEGKGPSSEAMRCYFDPAWLGSNCTSENSYGYYSGYPCVLFKFQKVYDWTSQSKLQVRCLLSEDRFQGNPRSVPVEAMWPHDGFKTNMIPQPRGGEHLWPLVMVQFTDIPDLAGGVAVDCKVVADNLASFDGKTETSMIFEGDHYEPDSFFGEG